LLLTGEPASTARIDLGDVSRPQLPVAVQEQVTLDQVKSEMLSGLRVLVVEDDPGIATDITDLVERAEGSVVGPVGSLQQARQVLKSEQPIDVAVLDVNLSDGDVTPVLEALRARRVGIVIYTGGNGLPPKLAERHPDLTVLQKPVQPGRLVGEIQRAHRDASGALPPPTD